MNRRIFLFPDSGGLSELVEQSFDAESVLQELLSEYPDLLAGDQMNEQEPRRWLLVTREAGVPDRVDGANRWSLDHLFLDQDGVPTLVEVKRSSDTRIRREVLGQMLDYAANGLAYWPVERVRSLYEADSDRQCEDAQKRLDTFLAGSQDDAEDFWQRVKTNLQAGRIRMVFVADEIPPELRRVVEFLNEQMDPAEVLAVAIRQYVGEGVKTLVPQVIGQTAEAQSRKGGGGGSRQERQWDEGSFFAEMEATREEPTVRGARRLYAWACEQFPEFWWGKGRQEGSRFFIRQIGDIRHSPFALWTSGRVEMQFQYMEKWGQHPFDDVGHRRKFLHRLNKIQGINLPEDSLSRRPSFLVSALADDQAWEQFKTAMAWYLEVIHNAAQDEIAP